MTRSSSTDPIRHAERPPYRVPLGLPRGRENRRLGAIVSLLLHLLLIYLIVTPFTHHHPIHEIAQGAGGAGPAGGGGGGHGGTGGQSRRETEHADFVALAPPPPKRAAVVPPPPKPVVQKPVTVPKPQVTAVAMAPTATLSAPALTPVDVSVVPGVGGGSGHDGSGGNGPGRGGGVGSGVGTGRGSGAGPGTGGGTQANYPPQPIEMFLPPYPIPDDVKGFHLVAEFDVDTTGRVLSMDFTPTPNRGYNRRLNEVLHAFKFRPGTTPEGTPVHMKAQIVVDLY